MSLKYRKYLGNNGKNWIWLTSKYIANNKQQVKLKVNIQVPLRDTKIFCQIISKRIFYPLFKNSFVVGIMMLSNKENLEVKNTYLKDERSI